MASNHTRVSFASGQIYVCPQPHPLLFPFRNRTPLPPHELSLLSNVLAALELPPPQDLASRPAPRPVEEPVSALLDQPRGAVHGVSRTAADLHVAHGRVRRDGSRGDQVCRGGGRGGEARGEDCPADGGGRQGGSEGDEGREGPGRERF